MDGNVGDDEEARVITAYFQTHILVSVYTPCSGMEARFEGKRRTFDHRIQVHMQTIKEQDTKQRPLIWAGDLNTAWAARDVYDSTTNADRARWPGCLPWEKENLERIAKEIGLVDVFQQLKPNAKGRKRFTFYERPSLREAGKGWRLDYYLADPALMVRDEHKLHVTDIQVLDEYYQYLVLVQHFLQYLDY
jgi:exonuclease III